MYVATKLGDLIDDTVIIGGLVPSLLIDQGGIRSDHDLHAGTLDLDVGLAVAIFDDQRYQALAERLRQAGFSQDENEDGKPTRQRWKLDAEPTVTVDFLITPTLHHDKPGKLRDLEGDFAAIITRGLHLAFADRERVRLDGKTMFGASASRDVWVAGPGAFVVLKALALRNRGEHKDAYDLFYVLRNLMAGPEEVARRLAPHDGDPCVRDALAFLRADFAEVDSVGPIYVAEFLSGGPDDDVQADARGLDFLEFCQ